MPEPDPKEPQSPGDLPDPRDFLEGDVSSDGLVPDLPSDRLPPLEFKGLEPEPVVPDEEDLRAKLKDAEERLEANEKRRSDSERSYQSEHQEAIWQRRLNEAMEQRFAMDRQATEAARTLEYPTLGDPDDLLDPTKLQDHLTKNLQVMEARMTALIKPRFDSMGRQGQLQEALLRAAKRDAIARGREEVEEAGYDDFKEFEQGIMDKFAGMEEGDLVMVQPDAVKDTYLLLRSRSGKPMNTPAKSDPPKVAGVRPNVIQERNERLERIRQGYGGMLEAVLPRIGIKSIDAANEDHLRILEKGLR